MSGWRQRIAVIKKSGMSINYFSDNIIVVSFFFLNFAH